MEKIDLVNGGWAQLRDADELSERLRRPLMTAMGRAGATNKGDLEDGGMGILIGVRDAMLVAFVESWSFDLPVKAAAFLELPSKVYDQLTEECLPRSKEAMPDFDPTPDTESPFTPSDV